MLICEGESHTHTYTHTTEAERSRAKEKICDAVKHHNHLFELHFFFLKLQKGSLDMFDLLFEELHF